MPATDPDFKPITLNDIHDEELDFEYKGKVRKIVLENGNYVWMECVDPYGYWQVSLKKGKLPDKIKDNNYTTFRDALTDVNRWLKERKHPIVYATTLKAPTKEA